MPELTLNTIRKTFGTFTAVQDIDLAFEDGQLTALLGPSGCGKTTLLRIIAGLEEPTAGQISLDGQDITNQRAEARRFGMVFQSFALFPHLNVAQNISYSLNIAGESKANQRARAEELLALVRLSDKADARIGELSGGQRQRVAIARALAQSPKVFLLDEPMSALDAQLRGDMQVELRLLQQRLGITTVVVTHDQREAMTMADKIVVMSQGRVEQVGTPQEIYHRPANAFVASFIGNANLFPAVVKRGGVTVGDHRFEITNSVAQTKGEAVTLFLRPESVLLSDTGNGTNTVPAAVTFVRDEGPVRELHLQTPIGQMTAEMPGSFQSSVKVGDQMHATLPAAALHVLPPSEGAV